MLCANRHAFRQHLRWWTNGGLLCPISEHAEDIMVTRSHRLIIYLSVSSHRLITSQPSSCFAGAGKLISFVQTYSIMSAEYPPRCPISWSSCLGSQSLPYPTLSILKKGLKRWDSPCLVTCWIIYCRAFATRPLPRGRDGHLLSVCPVRIIHMHLWTQIAKPHVHPT